MNNLTNYITLEQAQELYKQGIVSEVNDGKRITFKMEVRKCQTN